MRGFPEDFSVVTQRVTNLFAMFPADVVGSWPALAWKHAGSLRGCPLCGCGDDGTRWLHSTYGQRGGHPAAIGRGKLRSGTVLFGTSRSCPALGIPGILTRVQHSQCRRTEP
jgi:hypothetical protein